jgi:hypothetical protein
MSPRPLALETRRFDLPGNEVAPNRSGRVVLGVLVVVLLIVMLIWGIYMLPWFFEEPHPIPLCGRGGGCVEVPSSAYYPTVTFYTFIFAVAPAVFLYLVGRRLFSPRGADRLVLDNTTAGFHFPDGRWRRLPWSSPRFRLRLLDQRVPAAFEPVIARAPLTARLPGVFHPVALTEDSFQAILDTADSFGLTVERTTPSGRRRQAEVGTVQYLVQR